MGPGRPSTCLYPLQTLLLCFFAMGRALSVSVHEACEDFHPGAPSASSSWGLVHCARVWNTWSGTILQGFHEGYPDREALRQLSGELRRRGSPCIVREKGTLDGLGSSTFSHIAAWLYSKDVGCNWIIPDIHQGDAPALANPVQQHSTNLQAVYCDRTKWIPTKFNESRPLREDPRERRCAAVTWLRYLRLDSFSVPPPRAGVIKTVELDAWDPTPVQAIMSETMMMGIANVPWDQLQLSVTPKDAIQYAMNVGSWDATKRQHAREVLESLRLTFHHFPRPGYTRPTCPYDSSQLNFAIHVRLGDKDEGAHAMTEDYRSLLEKLMDTMSEVVQAEGQPAPVFYVFSKTVKQCPSEDTGTFDEFPDWELDPDEVRACIEAKVPDDCAEKQAGGEVCYPKRSGLFHVRGTSIVLNLDPDAINSLECMIEADGVVMGCSPFGSLAGILSRGVKIMSAACGGVMSWEQSQLAPPFAIAERGEMWVPIAGSWHNPTMKSTAVFQHTIKLHIANRDFLGDAAR